MLMLRFFEGIYNQIWGKIGVDATLKVICKVTKLR